MAETHIDSIGALEWVVQEWEKKYFGRGEGFPTIWYRGQEDASWVPPQPTVLRPWFLDRVKNGEMVPAPHMIPIQRECTINRQFRRMAASMLPSGASIVDVYFLAQHHGMPTRLLDWTANPLAALFFAVSKKPDTDGVVLVMNPRQVLPDRDEDKRYPYPFDVVDIRAPIVEEALTPLFDLAVPRSVPACVLPIHPDLKAGRMLQQLSCFTLHVPPLRPRDYDEYPEEPVESIEEAVAYRVPREAKEDLLIALRRMGVSYATLFPDLDNVAREIRTAWKLYPPAQ